MTFVPHQFWDTGGTTNDINLDHLVKVVFARFLYSKVIVFSFPHSTLWTRSSPRARELC